MTQWQFFNRGMLTQECQLWKGWSHRSDPLKSKRRGVLESKSHGKTELRCMKTYVINEATMFMILTRPPSPGIQTNPHQEPLTNFHWLCTIPDTNNDLVPISVLRLLAPVFPNHIFHQLYIFLALFDNIRSFLFLSDHWSANVGCNHRPLFSTRSTCSLLRPVGHLYCGPKPKPWQTALRGNHSSKTLQ